MTSYIEGALVKDEKIIYVGHISMWSLSHLIAGGIITLPLLGLFDLFGDGDHPL
jgi:hypothetical protein